MNTSKVRSTHITRHAKAPRATVYRALLNSPATMLTFDDANSSDVEALTALER